jgi:TolB-like protein/cytochrome c-type biogenesis protein CcmH/NrfG
VVKTTGDGLLAEFGSVVDAVRCAVAFQEGMAERNRNSPNDRRIEFRIGVNLGDVIVQDDDVYGDGVNVAARLEGLAEPGGLLLSGMVHEAVRAKLDYSFDDLGPQKVKNIAEPISAFRVRVPSDAGSMTDRIISAPPPLPDKPSIAVLPFENISGDPEQEFFADGITEDIITALSKISELLVVARNSTFVYKGRAVNVAEVRQELGVGYVLEGSVRTANNRVRITAQLIETRSGHHAWAERYDRELSDIFALQDEITNEIVVVLQVNLSEGEQARLRKRQTDNFEAWECFVRGSRDVTSATRPNKERAQELLERAVTLDPNFAVAWVYLCRLHWQDARAHWTDTPEESLDRAAECAERALAIDDTYPDSHAAIGIVRLFQRRFEDAVAAGENAVESGANSAETYIILAQTLNYVDRSADAAALIERAMRLFPYYPDNLLGILALSYRRLGRFEESIALDTERLKRNPDNMYSDHRLASVYMELGRAEEARRHVAEAIKKNPHASLRQIRFSEPYQNEEYLDRYLDQLRKAGMPE